MAKIKISAAVRTFIVQSLACFDTPKTVVDAVKREFGETISRQLVEAYDPTKRAGERLGASWRQLFDETRKAFLEDTGKIAISHRAVRLRVLDRMAQRAEEQGNMVLASSLLEQAAKEVGGSFTNQRSLDHRSSDGSMTPKPDRIVIEAASGNSDDTAPT